ncbi:MAG: sodium-dependent transporter [Tissierellia bacterium]|nr:sodium-dependent transporter [Tissierellia bacterium]
MEKNRATWNSRYGYIMAAAGFSIGLGNIWRFPYLAGKMGGGIFVLSYLIICIIIGIPLFYMEVSLGRKARSNPIKGMRKLEGKGSPWVLFGWFGILSAFIILTYYFQVMGWLIAYIFKMISGSLSSASDYGQVFNSFASNSLMVIVFMIASMIIVGFISSKELNQGLEKSYKIMIPALFIMLIILAIRSITLPGAKEGLKWFFKVDFSKLDSKVLLSALGQCFFSVGIASGGAFVYGSYLKEQSDLPLDGVIVIIIDSLAAILAGLVIFPAIFAMGINPDSGHKLLFITASELFSNVNLGSIFGAVFFILVFFAALSSALGYLEPIISTLSESMSMSRKKAVWLSLIAIFVFSLPNVLSFGVLSDLKLMGYNIFEFTDQFNGNIIMPIAAIILTFYTVFKWGFDSFKDEVNKGSNSFKLTNAYKPIVIFIIPVALIIILFNNVIF